MRYFFPPVNTRLHPDQGLRGQTTFFKKTWSVLYFVVSNHGGEYIPGAARVLPRIARAVGSDICVLADGGVRSGGDILKMLILGADAVMIGRPFCVAALGGFKEGVKTFIETIRTELIQAMVLTGTPWADQVDESILFKA